LADENLNFTWNRGKSETEGNASLPLGDGRDPIQKPWSQDWSVSHLCWRMSKAISPLIIMSSILMSYSLKEARTWFKPAETRNHWHRLVKNIGGKQILGWKGGNNWWKHRCFSIIGARAPAAPKVYVYTRHTLADCAKKEASFNDGAQRECQ